MVNTRHGQGGKRALLTRRMARGHDLAIRRHLVLVGHRVGRVVLIEWVRARDHGIVVHLRMRRRLGVVLVHIHGVFLGGGGMRIRGWSRELWGCFETLRIRERVKKE